VAGVLLVAPYNRLTDVAQYHMPVLPVRWLLWDRFPSEEYLRRYHGPVVMLLTARDEVVPYKFGRRLYDGYAGPKLLRESDYSDHNSVSEQGPEFWRQVVEFWRKNRSANRLVEIGSLHFSMSSSSTSKINGSPEELRLPEELLPHQVASRC
jgi:hypothetical protein